jgi:uncharacterized protein
MDSINELGPSIPKTGKKDFVKIEKMKLELSKELDHISDSLETARNDFDYNRHGRDYPNSAAYEFDVKMYKGPTFDFESTIDKHFNGDEEAFNMAYTDHLGREMEFFVENLQQALKMDWIKDYYQVGRSGGWLVLELLPYTWSEGDVEDRYNEIENVFHNDVNDYSDNEDDIFTADMKSIQKSYKEAMKQTKLFHSETQKHIQQLHEIKKMIPAAQEQADKNFFNDLNEGLEEDRIIAPKKMLLYEEFNTKLKGGARLNEDEVKGEFSKVEKWVKKQGFEEDWDWDGKTLVIFADKDGENFKRFSKEQLEKEGVFNEDDVEHDYTASDKLFELYETKIIDEAKEWADDAHDEHTVESYMKENATHIAHISVGALKKCGEEWDDARKESAMEGLIEAYTKKIREIQEMDKSIGSEEGDIQSINPNSDDKAGSV